MKPLDKVTENEKYMIEYAIDNYAQNDEYTEGGRTVSINYILREWNESKSNLFDVFGQELILEKDYQYTRTKDDLCQEIYDTVMYSFSGKLDKNAYEFYQEYRANFALFDAPHYNVDIMKFIWEDVLAANRWIYDDEIEVPLKDGKIYKVQKGTKIMKVLAKIADAYNISHFEDFRLAISRCTNQKVLKGKLCLSIHPLDYITMSDNNEGWESCMSWQNSGCYRQGTVEMMNSPMVLVAYLKSDSNNIDMGSGLNWNSKKWRQLFILNEDCITNIKPYPYNNEQITKDCLDWIKYLAENRGYAYYADEISKLDAYNYHCVKHGDRIMYFILNPRTNNMYNDFHNGAEPYCYVSAGFFGNPSNENYSRIAINFNYSGKSECMFCGDLNPYIDSEENLICTSCGEIRYCACCGERIYGDDYYYDEDSGDYYCRDCYDDNFVTTIDDENKHYDRRCDERFFIVDKMPKGEEISNIDVYEEPIYIYDRSYLRCYVNEDNIMEVSTAFGWHNYHLVKVDDLKEAFFEDYSYAYNDKIDKETLRNRIRGDSYYQCIPIYEKITIHPAEHTSAGYHFIKREL